MGGKTSNSTSQVQVPQEVLDRYTSVNQTAEKAAATPFQTYSSDPNAFVAPINAQENTGIAGINAAAGIASPYFSAARQQLGAAQDATTPFYNQAASDITGAQSGAQPYQGLATGYALAGGQAVNPGALNTQDYISPYLNTVLQGTAGLLNQNNQQAMSGQTGSAISNGAFGGDRAGIAAANLSQQQQLASASIYSGILNDAYGQALSTAQQQQGVNLGAQQANRAALSGVSGQLLGIGQQGFNQGIAASQAQSGLGQTVYGTGAATSAALAGLGTGEQSAALQGSQAQLAAGQLQQQTDQAGLAALYNQFLQQKSYPFQTAQFLGNIAEGTGALSGSTTTTTQPGGLFSDERLKENLKVVGKTFDGQKIYAYNYKGDDTPRMGLVAQEVEKKHPGAVGVAGGYRTVDYGKATEDAAERGKFAGGGSPTLPGLSGTDYGDLLAAQSQMYAPFNQYGLYGAASSGAPMGGSSYVPEANLPVSALTVAGPAEVPKSGLDEALKIAQLAKTGADGMDWVKNRRTTGTKVANDNAEREADGGAVGDNVIPYSAPRGLSIPTDNPQRELMTAKVPDKPDSSLGDLANVAAIAGLFKNRGGVARRYARGGYAFGGDPGDDDGDMYGVRVPITPSNPPRPIPGATPEHPFGPPLVDTFTNGPSDVAIVAPKPSLSGFAGAGQPLPKPARRAAAPTVAGAGPTVYAAPASASKAGVISQLGDFLSKATNVASDTIQASRANGQALADLRDVEHAASYGGQSRGMRAPLPGAHPIDPATAQSPEGLRALVAYNSSIPNWSDTGHRDASQNGSITLSDTDSDTHPSAGVVPISTVRAARPGSRSPAHRSAGVSGRQSAATPPSARTLGDVVDPVSGGLNAPPLAINDLNTSVPDTNVHMPLGARAEDAADRVGHGLGNVGDALHLTGDGGLFSKIRHGDTPTIMSILAGLAAAGTAPTSHPLTALAAGIGAGANTYMGTKGKQADIAQTQAEAGLTRAQIPVQQSEAYARAQATAPEGQQAVPGPNPNGASIVGPDGKPWHYVLKTALTDYGASGIHPDGSAGSDAPEMPTLAPTHATDEIMRNSYGIDPTQMGAANRARIFGQNPALADQDKAAAASIAARVGDIGQSDATRRQLLQMAQSTAALSSGTLSGQGYNSALREKYSNIYATARSLMGLAPDPTVTQDLTSHQILDKLRTLSGSTMAGQNGETAASIAHGISAVLPSGELTPQAAQDIISQMLVANQQHPDLSQYAQKFVNRYGVSLGAENAFQNGAAPVYGKEQHVLSALFADPKFEAVSNALLNAPPELAAQRASQFDAKYGIPGLHRYITGGQ